MRTVQREVDVLKERVRAQEVEVEAEEREIRRAANAGEVKERWELGEGTSEGWNWRMEWIRSGVCAGGEGGDQQGAGAEAEAVREGGKVVAGQRGAAVGKTEGMQAGMTMVRHSK